MTHLSTVSRVSAGGFSEPVRSVWWDSESQQSRLASTVVVYDWVNPSWLWLSHVTISFKLTKPHLETSRGMLYLLLPNDRLFQKSPALLFNHIILILISISFMMIILLLAVLSFNLNSSFIGCPLFLFSMQAVLLPHSLYFCRVCPCPPVCVSPPLKVKKVILYWRKSLIQNQKKETQFVTLLTLL